MDIGSTQQQEIIQILTNRYLLGFIQPKLIKKSKSMQ